MPSAPLGRGLRPRPPRLRRRLRRSPFPCQWVLDLSPSDLFFYSNQNPLETLPRTRPERLLANLKYPWPFLVSRRPFDLCRQFQLIYGHLGPQNEGSSRTPPAWRLFSSLGPPVLFVNFNTVSANMAMFVHFVHLAMFVLILLIFQTPDTHLNQYGHFGLPPKPSGSASSPLLGILNTY